MQHRTLIAIVLLSLSFSIHIAASADYGTALKKSLLFFEAQRSGKLPSNQRVQWRGDSALGDGQNEKIDLIGGYYDAGDNLKLGFPLAFTITMLSWSTVEFRDKLSAKSELSNALAAIKWGTDYLMKAHSQPNVLYGQVGETDSDHQCWQRPEDMTTPRTAFKIDDQHPGSDLAAETAAAFAAASVAFQPVDGKYASQLLPHAKNLFEFAHNRPGLYSDRIREAKKIYASSGYEDEMLWAAAWLYLATNDKSYLKYIESKSGNSGGLRTTFSWDDKYVGAQLLVAKFVLEGKIRGEGWTAGFKKQAEDFICSCAQRHSNNVKKTPGGLLWFLPWNNVQYVATASFATAVYSKYLSQKKASLQCNAGTISPSDLTKIAKSQVDYILGSNPKKMSYMVGFGSSYPQKVHHRAASIVSIKKDPSPVSCKGGFDKWFNRNEPNPNVIEGAVVSADVNDNYEDSRSNFQKAEPTTVTNGPLVGVLAYLA